MSGFKISQYSDSEEEAEEWVEEEDEEWVEEEDEILTRSKRFLVGHSSSSSHITATSAAEHRSKCTNADAKRYSNLYEVSPVYGLCAPTSEKRAHEPPPGYATIYVDHFKSGLKLPMQPFVVAVLAHYEIALAQLHPIGVYNIVGFMNKCEGISVVPTIGLFRHYYQLRRSNNSRGWYRFSPKTIKIVHNQPSVKGWEDAFFFFKVIENVKSMPWNYSVITKPPLPDERPSEEAIAMLDASAERSSKRKWADVHQTPLQSHEAITSKASPRYNFRQKRQKRTVESPSRATENGNSELPPVQGLKGMTSGQFARFIEKCVSYFNLQLEGDKQELEKAVEDKVQDVKIKDNEIASLQNDKKELEMENNLLKSEISRLRDLEESRTRQKVIEDKDREIVLLKSKLKSVMDDRKPLLKVYTWKLLKTKGFSKFCCELTALGQRLGRHVATKKIKDRCPTVPLKAFTGLEDFLAESKLDNKFYSMVQDDGFEFPLLNHLLSIEEIPSSSQLKDLDVDEDKNALTPPPPVLVDPKSE